MKIVNTGNVAHTFCLCDSWLKGKKVFGEQMQGDVTKKNKISFDGTVQMIIMPQRQKWNIDGDGLHFDHLQCNLWQTYLQFSYVIPRYLSAFRR